MSSLGLALWDLMGKRGKDRRVASSGQTQVLLQCHRGCFHFQSETHLSQHALCNTVCFWDTLSRSYIASLLLLKNIATANIACLCWPWDWAYPADLAHPVFVVGPSWCSQNKYGKMGRNIVTESLFTWPYQTRKEMKEVVTDSRNTEIRWPKVMGTWKVN